MSQFLNCFGDGIYAKFIIVLLISAAAVDRRCNEGGFYCWFLPEGKYCHILLLFDFLIALISCCLTGSLSLMASQICEPSSSTIYTGIAFWAYGKSFCIKHSLWRWIFLYLYQYLHGYFSCLLRRIHALVQPGLNTEVELGKFDYVLASFE
jgi:hypothetical protein